MCEGFASLPPVPGVRAAEGRRVGPGQGNYWGLFISYKGLLGCHPCDLVLGWESGGGAGRKGPGWPVEVGAHPSCL